MVVIFVLVCFIFNNSCFSGLSPSIAGMAGETYVSYSWNNSHNGSFTGKIFFFLLFSKIAPQILTFLEYKTESMQKWLLLN